MQLVSLKPVTGTEGTVEVEENTLASMAIYSHVFCRPDRVIVRRQVCAVLDANSLISSLSASLPN